MINIYGLVITPCPVIFMTAWVCMFYNIILNYG
jgi:hypothetical protein